MLTFSRAEGNEMPLDRLVDAFREWFDGFPWLERYRCPMCNVYTDFGSEGRYADIGDGKCPTCGNHLMPYWTDERVIEYYFDAVRRPGFHMVVGRDEDGVVRAWAWGYALNPELVPPDTDVPAYFYGDHVGVDRAYRGPDSLEVMTASFASLRSVGWTHMVIRTHVDAVGIQHYLADMGFAQIEKAGEADRIYMSLEMPE